MISQLHSNRRNIGKPSANIEPIENIIIIKIIKKDNISNLVYCTPYF